MRIFLSTVIATSLLTISQAAQPVPKLPPTHAEKHVLPNGLTVIIHVDRSAPVASLQAWCGTGSIHERNWMGAGLSHILEHMLFKGTKTRPAGEIARQIQDQGGMINAYTSFDRTVYWIDVPSSGAMGALDILADAMLNSTLPEDEYVKEQEVIRREFAMGFDDVNRQGSQLMLRTVFSESPFRHPVIGYLDVYNKLTRDDVMAYYKERYVPNNLTFVISGDVDPQAVLEKLKTTFDGVPRQVLEPTFIASEPEQLGRRDAHEEFAATELTRMYLAWRIPGLDDPDTPALDLLGIILGSGRSSLLTEQIREKDRLAHHISSGMFSLQTDGVFVIQAVCDPDKRLAVEKASLAIVENIQKEPPTEALLDRAKRQILSSQISGLSTARGRASDLGSNWLLARNLNFTSHYLDMVSKVTPDDITRVANKYLRNDHLNATSLNPPGSLAAAEPQTESSASAGEVQKFTLPNGLRLLVREDSRLPLVDIIASFRGGVLAESPANNGITKLMARSLLKGTKNRSASEIAAQIENVGGEISSDSGNNSFSVTAQVLAPDLPLAVDVVSDVLLNPLFDASQVDLERAAQLAAIKADDEQITSVARNVTREKFFGDHPYSLRSGGSATAVASLKPADLQAFHDELVVGSNGVIAVFGDVKAAEVRALVEKAFAKMPEGRPAFADVPAPRPPAKPVAASVPMDKKQAVLMFAFPSPAITSPEMAAMELINEASNDLGSRFFDRIREQLGLAYFVGAANLTGPVPGTQIFYLGTDPAKVEKVQKEFRDEIAKLAASGLTPEELARAKKKALGSDAIRNQNNSAFASSVVLDELLGLGFDEYRRRQEQIAAVTLEDTKAAAAKYLAVPGYVSTVVAPQP
ncbi:MAG: pitrilysin family protein [Terrimicrobiaceae bacterium]